MSARVYKVNATGSTAINATMVVPVGDNYRLVSVGVHFSVAPATSENFTVTLDANAGAGYDTLLYSLDVSAGSDTDVMWLPDEEIMLEGGDAIDVAFANSDSRTYGLQITMKAV